MELVKIKISELKAAPYNPRKSTITQDENLKRSLEKFGLVDPIIFNKQTGYIVGGHFRVRELKKLGYKEVDCVVVDLSPEDEKELNIRLNANTGEFDWEVLSTWDNSEQLTEWGLDLPNFAAGHDVNNMTDEDVDLMEDFDPVGITKDCQRVVFIFANPEDAESYLKSQSIDFVKRNMAWQVNMNTLSI